MQRYPTTAETKKPQIIGPQLNWAICFTSNSKIGYTHDAPIIIGKLNKNEYFAALTLVKPHARPVAIVSPERENPGKTARPCAIPIKTDFFVFTSSPSLENFWDIFSDENKTKPVIIKHNPTK